MSEYVPIFDKPDCIGFLVDVCPGCGAVMVRASTSAPELLAKADSGEQLTDREIVAVSMMKVVLSLGMSGVTKCHLEADPTVHSVALILNDASDIAGATSTPGKALH